MFLDDKSLNETFAKLYFSSLETGRIQEQPQELMFNSNFGEFPIMQELSVNLSWMSRLIIAGAQLFRGSLAGR